MSPYYSRQDKVRALIILSDRLIAAGEDTHGIVVKYA